jgi:membrane-bound serine protease (ClpP class)
VHRVRFLLFLFCCLAAVSAPAQDSPAIAPGAIWVLDLDGAVGPATSDYLLRGMEHANAAGAGLIVIRMNTPGGLDGAMRDIIQGILASRVPVATWVSPQGARAASAGTYILYASHIAAMAPATTLGAATPVSIGGPGSLSEPGKEQDPEAAPEPEAKGSTAMERKMINDAAAYIRGLAELRGRNSEWAELAVRDARSLSAEEALEQNVIDLVAANMDNSAPLHEAAPDWRTQFLATITDPNLVLILGMIGFYGIILEFYNPGSLVPGTIGVICLLLAGYSLQLLPVNYAGLALLVVGIGLMIAEAMAPSFGILGMGGVVAFVMGGIILFDSEIDAFRVGWPILLAFALVTAGFIIVTISLALRMRRQQVSTGIEQIVGLGGEALEDIANEGQVRVGAEIWQARSDHPIEKGSRITVTEVSGLELHVKEEKV